LLDLSRLLPKRLHDYLYAEDEQSGEALQRAHEVVAWHKGAATQRLLRLLAEEIEKPAAVGDHVAMISDTAKLNVYRALKHRLETELSNAKRVIGEANND